ncbi:MAG TPA: nitroreductase family protein [Candidatus Paceibacterota bacterium]|nr:nitroreductase family protein [Verrucomicrobiota bacterium]HRY49187.1 nitroreductase family protein [Candidatus Paceibacterota bacterium]HSA03866.1 nitroreductase family protein [Candidatus Paceibacterota bacterium]
MKLELINKTAILLFLLAGAMFLSAAGSETRSLAAPRMNGGKPLLQTLKERQSIREYVPDVLSDQQLSDLLWAAFGMNRPEIDHRTAPSAQNTQDVDIYVVMAQGVFLYEAKPHQLKKVSDRDLRPLTSGQPFAKIAPVQLVFVSDYARMPKVSPGLRDLYAGVDTGCIVQNVYLFCASENLASVVHELDRDPLAKALELRPDQHIVVAQTVGYAKK